MHEQKQSDPHHVAKVTFFITVASIFVCIGMVTVFIF